MYANDLGKLQSIIVDATRCLECKDRNCYGACPEHVDVHAAMRLIVQRAPREAKVAWVQQPEQATQSARDGVEASFEPE